MKKICMYISDHGYGHASREIPVIQQLLNTFSHIQIYVKTSHSLEFLKSQITDKRVVVLYLNNDFGVCNAEDNFEVSLEKTEVQLQKWLKSWKEYIAEEIRFCRKEKIDLILTDIAPQPLLVADKLGIPGIFLGNFTWYEIYKHFFHTTDMQPIGKFPQISNILNAYTKATIAIIYPFYDVNKEENEFANLNKVPLVVRSSTIPQEKMRKILGLSQQDKVIYLGMGFSVKAISQEHKLLIDALFKKGYKILVSFNSMLSGKNIIKIDRKGNSQDYLQIADVCISKSGYSTVGECIRGKVPVLLVKRALFNDDCIISKTVEKLGIGMSVSKEEFDHLIENGILDEFLRKKASFKSAYNNLPSVYQEDGVNKVIKIIKKYL